MYTEKSWQIIDWYFTSSSAVLRARSGPGHPDGNEDAPLRSLVIDFAPQRGRDHDGEGGIDEAAFACCQVTWNDNASLFTLLVLSYDHYCTCTLHNKA